MSRRSIALPSSQQPLLQVQSQSKSNSSQSYALLSIALQRPVFCPPHASLTSVRVTLPRVTFDRSPAEPLHRRWHAPPASYDRHGSCHFNRSPAVLEWCLVTLCPSGVVVAGSVGTGFRPSWFHLDDDDIIMMMMPFRRCRRLPHAT